MPKNLENVWKVKVTTRSSATKFLQQSIKSSKNGIRNFYKKFTLVNSNEKYNKARESRNLSGRQSELFEGKILFYSLHSNKSLWHLFNFKSFGYSVY